MYERIFSYLDQLTACITAAFDKIMNSIFYVFRAIDRLFFFRYLFCFISLVTKINNYWFGLKSLKRLLSMGALGK